MSRIEDEIDEQREITKIKSSIMDNIIVDIIKDCEFEKLKAFEKLAIRKILIKKHKWFCRIQA